ncbi:MAG: tetratricopeptide repeat protein, partial [Myxococcales bacterium]|nr:tetratricopeptide repeat protein [Myxococcales bacterium]
LGACFAQAESIADAERFFRYALAMTPMNRSAALGLHRLLHKDGRPDEAAAVIREFVQYNPDDPEIAALRPAD